MSECFLFFQQFVIFHKTKKNLFPNQKYVGDHIYLYCSSESRNGKISSCNTLCSFQFIVPGSPDLNKRCPPQTALCHSLYHRTCRHLSCWKLVYLQSIKENVGYRTNTMFLEIHIFELLMYNVSMSFNPECAIPTTVIYQCALCFTTCVFSELHHCLHSL